MKCGHLGFGLCVAVILVGCEGLIGISPPDGPGPKAAKELPLEAIRLPEGYEIDVWARVPNARSLALGPEGTVFVGTRQGSSVWALRDEDGDHHADTAVQIGDDLDTPNGVAVHSGDLYVAEISRILRFDDIEAHLDEPPDAVVIRDDLPSERHHGWKYIAFGPDERLYVPVGAPCNVCESEDERFATILRMKPDGGELEVFARGVRNTVGFDWHPETGDLWFTDNGRDWLGDDQPPDELNRAPKPGLHFGFPFCHGGDLTDPDHGDAGSCSEAIPPVRKLGPHVAALGMLFVRGVGDEGLSVLIAEHGSWNRSEKIGYRIMRVNPDAPEGPAYEVFAEGWLVDGEVWGRPVDLLRLPDGSLLVSDDYAGAIYRISGVQDSPGKA